MDPTGNEKHTQHKLFLVDIYHTFIV